MRTAAGSLRRRIDAVENRREVFSDQEAQLIDEIAGDTCAAADAAAQAE